MTTDRIAGRNRANARYPSGSGTARGRTRSAGNARRHGATARADPEQAAIWLSIILDRPGITLQDALPSDARGACALALAEAEVRLLAAQRALRRFEAGREGADDVLHTLRTLREDILEALIERGGTRTEITIAVSLLTRILRLEDRSARTGDRRQRLLRRYLREARARRQRAFSAWIAISGSQEAVS